MMRFYRFFSILLLLPGVSAAQRSHDSPAPQRLGEVAFENSCAPAVQPQFQRAIALLHSFAYAPARDAFSEVEARDPRCAMAHWGMAMTYFHQLWEPPIYPADLALGRQETERAMRLQPGTEREGEYIAALAAIYRDAGSIPYRQRVLRYERAMREIAARNGKDVEAQVFHALAVLATAPPADKTHANQKQAVAILVPLYRRFPRHPGIAHYLIHACDNAELARQGLPAARAYAKIAPSAPHALHMPSHIFTRLGMWQDSVRSNLAAQDAARRQGDVGEELHAMDYLVYAYLQMGRESEAAQVVRKLNSLSALDAADFKIGYAATAMPVRLALERRRWAEAATAVAPAGVAPQVAATAVWARALGLGRNGHIAQARVELVHLRRIESELRAGGNEYWATQTRIQAEEAAAWIAAAEGKSRKATTLLRQAARREDAVEKLPVTPGPVIPAREQLGEWLLEIHEPQAALEAFKAALAGAPGRRGALLGAARAAEMAGELKEAERFRKELRRLRSNH
jgi:Tfp pilus assembly protein PilF